MTESVTITIVIVNKDDPDIAATLDALQNLEHDRSTEIVVVDASNGRLDDVRSAHPSVNWINYEQLPSAGRTIAQQRNVGVEHSNGDFIVFLDAGCIPCDGWLDSLVEPLRVTHNVISVGSVISKEGRSFHDHDESAHDDGAELSEFSTMNVAIPREAFVGVGPFDEKLGMAEDVDFAWRARDKGFAIRYTPKATISHDWGSPSTDVQRAFRYGVARVRLIRKHRSHWRNLYHEDLVSSVYALYLLGSPLTFFFPWYLGALAIPLFINRRRQPVAKICYHLIYGAGMLSELFHVPIVASQRKRSAQE